MYEKNPIVYYLCLLRLNVLFKNSQMSYPTMRKLIVFLLSLFAVQLMYAQSTRQLSLNNTDYRGYLSVCTDCREQAQAGLMYYYYTKDGKVAHAIGKIEGQPLHGTAKLLSPLSDTDKEELILEGNFVKGLPDGELKHYVFGVLELVETYEQGKLKKRLYFLPSNQGGAPEADRAVEYLGVHPQGKRVRLSYFSSASRIDAEAIEKEYNGELYHIYDGIYRRFYVHNGKEELKEEGQYHFNKPTGEWKTYYNEGVVGVRQYDEKGILLSERFLKRGQPFTGTVIDEIFNNRIRVGEYEVKEGLRNGVSKWARRSNNYQKQLSYVNGLASEPHNDAQAFQNFLKERRIVQEATLQWQCDQRGGGLFIDKVQYTDKNEAIFYVTFRSVSLKPYSSVFTAAPNDKEAFSVIDIATQKVFPVKAVYGLDLPPAFYPITYGEQISFQLVFEGLGPTQRFISLIEGDPLNSYIVKEDGTAQYLWGCYEVNLK